MGFKGVIFYVTHPSNSSALFDIRSLIEHGNSFIYNFIDSFPVHDHMIGIIFLSLFLAAVVFLLKNESNKNLRNYIYYLILLVPISFLVFSFLRNAVYNYYLIHLSVSYIIIVSYLVHASYKQKRTKIFLILLLLICIFTLRALVSSVKTSIYDYSDYGGNAKLKGQMAAVDYIYSDAKGKPFGVLVFAPPIYTYQYDYLLWWYGQRKYHYIPYKEKKGTFYLLIEKDPAKAWSYKGWLETVIKSGKIIYTKLLPSGFIVQKRVENE